MSYPDGNQKPGHYSTYVNSPQYNGQSAYIQHAQQRSNPHQNTTGYSKSPPYAQASSYTQRHYQPPSVPNQWHCMQQPCSLNGVSFARKADLQRHCAVIHDPEQLQRVNCEWPGCHRLGNYGFTRKDKMIDHMREVHKADIPKRRPSRDSTTAQASSSSSQS